MTTVSLGDILDDLRAADQALRRFEQRYWLSSDVFFELYQQGRLDDGENLEDFSEWAGFYRIKQQREELLRRFSQERVAELSAASQDDLVTLESGEPKIEVPA
jgi:hypothetical protein